VTKTRLISMCLPLALAACGSSSNAPADAGHHVPDGGEAPASDATGGDVSSDARDGATEPGGSAKDAAVDAAPELIAPPGLTKLLVSGRASLVGSGPNSCTNEPGAAGDRWCGFALPGAVDGHYDLWVFDATRAATGADLRCDGTDASCLRLSTNAYFDRFVGAGNDGFEGDTLIYQTDADPTVISSFAGTVSAWRPGWAAGRALTSGEGVVCSGHKTRQVALCLQDRSETADGDVSYALVAGSLPAAGGAPLPVVERVITALGTDAAGAEQFQVSLSPDGAWLAWSARPTASGQETLKVQKIDDATTRQTVAANVSSWDISRDGTRWLWLRAYNHSDLEPSGTLELATFPTGADVSTLATAVADYQQAGPKGVLYRAGVVHTLGDLRLMPDRDAPATTKLLDEMVAAVLARSEDARTVVYTKTITGVGNDVFVWSADLDMGSSCPVWLTPSATRSVTLLANDHVLVWSQGDVMTQVISAAATSLPSCETTIFGTDLLRWLPIGDDRILYVDGAKDGAYTGTLRATSADDHGVGHGTPLSAVVDPVYAPLTPALPAVVYTVGSGGLYLYTGPLLGAPPTQADAGQTGQMGNDGGDAGHEDGAPGATDTDGP
jgi:hypothetical protein